MTIKTDEKAEVEEHNVSSSKQQITGFVVLKTTLLFGTWIAMGMSQVLLPATLPDLLTRVGITVEEFGRANIFKGLGGILGALLSSVADRYNQKADLLMSMFVMTSAIVLATRPFCTSLWMLSCGFFFEGISWTSVNAVGNPMLLSLWGEKSGGPMQVLHFGYPVGATIGPLIAYNFVSKEQENLTTNATTESFPQDADESRIEIPYMIVGCYDAFISILFIVFQFMPTKSKNTQLNKVSTSSWKDVFSPSKWAEGDSKFGVTIIIFLMLFYFINVATIIGSALYFPTYAVDSDLNYTNQEATLYTSAFNLFGALGRCSCILVAIFLPIHFLFPMAVFGQAFGGTLILIWGLQTKLAYVVTSCIFSYLSFPVWPCGYSWADRYIFLFAIGIGLSDIASRVSDIIFSYMLAYLYDFVAKESIFYNTVAAGWGLFILVIIMSIIAGKHGSKYENKQQNNLSNINLVELNVTKKENEIKFPEKDEQTKL